MEAKCLSSFAGMDSQNKFFWSLIPRGRCTYILRVIPDLLALQQPLIAVQSCDLPAVPASVRIVYDLV